MACMLPSNFMTAQEKACCLRMAHRCGDHTMPSTHSCCKTITSPERDAFVRSSFNVAMQFDFVYLVQPTVTSAEFISCAIHFSYVFGQSPESPPSSSEILRI